MAGSQRGGGGGAPSGLQPPKPHGGQKPGGVRGKVDTSKHAEEVRSVRRGRDIVEQSATRAGKPPAFDRKELLVARSWFERRPLETGTLAAPLIRYPRMWATKRGRYCKFKAPGAGVYGLLRARSTF